jgi:hypothetical protein
MKKELYITSHDKFRGVIEIIYVLFIIYYAFVEIYDYTIEWKAYNKELSQLNPTYIPRKAKLF